MDMLEFRYEVQKNSVDASSSRRREHRAGSVLAVRDQEAHSRNEEMRRISAVF